MNCTHTTTSAWRTPAQCAYMHTPSMRMGMGMSLSRRVRTVICVRCGRFAEGSDNMDKQVNRLDLRSLQYLNPLPHVHSHRCRESLFRYGRAKCRGDLAACRQQRQPGCVLKADLQASGCTPFRKMKDERRATV